MQVLLELLVVLPHAAVGGVDRAGPVVRLMLTIMAETAFCRRNDGRAGSRADIIVAGPLPADGRDRQDEVAHPGLLQPAALPQEQQALGSTAPSRSMTVAAMGLPMPKLMMVMFSAVALGMGCPLAEDGGVVPLGEPAQVVAKFTSRMYFPNSFSGVSV